MYIEATLPRLQEPNYEIWLLRLFHPGIGSHYTIGQVLIPREFLFSIKNEALCLQKVFEAIIEDFKEMPIKKFMIATKRNMHFVARVEKVITEKMSPDIKVKSKQTSLFKVLYFIFNSVLYQFLGQTSRDYRQKFTLKRR